MYAACRAAPGFTCTLPDDAFISHSSSYNVMRLHESWDQQFSVDMFLILCDVVMCVKLVVMLVLWGKQNIRVRIFTSIGLTITLVRAVILFVGELSPF